MSPTNTALLASKGIDASDAVFITVMIILIVLIIVAVVVCCCCENKCNRVKEPYQPEALTTEQLIPPIFYTDDMKDPLQQDDLREHLKNIQVV